jgi:hypothetical protein
MPPRCRWVQYDSVNFHHNGTDEFARGHFMYQVCESSSALCVIYSVVDVASNVAVGAWTCCSGYQMLVNLTCPAEARDNAFLREKLTQYHCVSWGSALGLGLASTVWGWADAGPDEVAYRYRGYRILCVILPSMLSVIIGAVIGLKVAWRLSQHSTNLNWWRVVEEGCLYLGAIVLCWGPFTVYQILFYEGTLISPHGRKGWFHEFVHIWMQLLGCFQTCIYFAPGSRKLYERMERLGVIR